MARKAIVDKNTVLKLLKEGKSSQTIANQFGVSRQAIDLYRKEFTRTGIFPVASAAPLPDIVPATENAPEVQKAVPTPSPTSPAPQAVSLDQMIELSIKAFDALKRLPELEAEVAKYRADYENLAKQLEQMLEREKKRKEQETRWLYAQNPDILTHRP
jgi:uncharacterized membrane protein